MPTALPQVWLVRHGETAWSLSGQHTGRTDIPLTAHGEEQARALQSELRQHHFASVLSSPLVRASRTGELAGFAGTLQTSPDLLEWDYGRYEGLRTADIRAQRPEWNLFEHGGPGGESLADVVARAARLIEAVRGNAQDALLFAHRDILRVIAALWVGLRPADAQRLYMDPASISVLSYDHTLQEPIIRSLNWRPLLSSR
jgi:broad specificity phosphatase PhoE